MKLILAALLAGVFLTGCEERYRYPCQDPHNWNEEHCKKPFCSGNGTCPEDLAHYLKENSAKGQPTQIPQVDRGACK